MRTKLVLNHEIINEQKNLIEDYWKSNEHGFTYKVKDIEIKYDISISKLKSLVAENSKFYHIYNCSVCNVEFEYLIKNRTSLKFENSSKNCENCEQILNEKRKEERRIYFEQKDAENKLKIEQRNKLLEIGVNNKNWLNLTEYEFEILCKIIENNNISAIKKDIKLGYYRLNPTFWQVLYKLEKLNLVVCDRNPNYVEYIHISPNISDLITKPVQFSESKILSFMLSKNVSPKSIKSPQYSNYFTIPEDVTIKSGVKYIAGGWTNSDGSITLKFTPVDLINPTTNEPLKKDDEDNIMEFFDELE